MAENNRQKGSRYEEQAAAYLAKNGIKVIERNYRCRLGEVDIIAKDGKYLCFVEVKYRKTNKTGYPSAAVTPAKQRTIFKVASVYLKQYGMSFDTPCRFDVVSVSGDDILYIKNAFGGM